MSPGNLAFTNDYNKAGRQIKSTFARFGNPAIMVHKTMCKQYDITHRTSSPHNPQDNGLADCQTHTETG